MASGTKARYGSFRLVWDRCHLWDVWGVSGFRWPYFINIWALTGPRTSHFSILSWNLIGIQVCLLSLSMSFFYLFFFTDGIAFSCYSKHSQTLVYVCRFSLCTSPMKAKLLWSHLDCTGMDFHINNKKNLLYCDILSFLETSFSNLCSDFRGLIFFFWCPALEDYFSGSDMAEFKFFRDLFKCVPDLYATTVFFLKVPDSYFVLSFVSTLRSRPILPWLRFIQDTTLWNRWITGF